MEGTSMNSRILEEMDWVIQVQNSLTEESPHGSSQVYPYPRVPKYLRNKNTEAFYTPKVISFGPYHFQMKKLIFDDEVEVLKSEVARKFNGLLPNGLPAVVQNLMCKETHEKIKVFYAKGSLYFLSWDALAWMMTRDACFLEEILNRFSKEEKEESTEIEVQIPFLSIDHVLCRKRYHPLLHEIVKDMFKMENQLPLWVLNEIRNPLGRCEDGCFESALKNLSPIEVFRKDGNESKCNGEHHFLHLLHEYIVDSTHFSRQAIPSSSSSRHERPSSSPLSILQVAYVLILLILLPFLVIRLTWLIIQLTCDFYQNKAEKEKYHVPTLRELRSVGVKFKKLDDRGICHMMFDEGSRTLYLPKFKVDDRSGVILRNLMAMEICSQKTEKPITRYAFLMNDLVNTSEDIAILRRKKIIINKLGSDDDAAWLWNSIVVATEMPIYAPIDSTAEKINAYKEKRWKSLWPQFIYLWAEFVESWARSWPRFIEERFVLNPWLGVSLLGGILLLLLTIVQVACLFFSCQIK